MYCRDTELRKLHPVEIEKLARYLGESGLWRQLIAAVQDADRNNELMFSTDHVKIVENASRLLKKPESEIFLEEWSTMGRRRPTLGVLLDYLVKLELFRAADYLAVDILKAERPKRPKFGPAAEVQIDDSVLAELLRQQAQVKNAPRESQPDTWSLNCQGSTVPVECAEQPGRPNDPADAELLSDLMKFSATQPKNLIQFSAVRHAPANDDDNNNYFVLQAADSQDIPFVVKMRGQTDSEDDVTDCNDTSEVVTSSSRNSDGDTTTNAFRLRSSTEAPGESKESDCEILIPVTVFEASDDNVGNGDGNKDKR